MMQRRASRWEHPRGLGDSTPAPNTLNATPPIPSPAQQLVSEVESAVTTVYSTNSLALNLLIAGAVLFALVWVFQDSEG